MLVTKQFRSGTKTGLLLKFFKISSMFHKREKVIQICKDMRVSK